MRLDDLLDSDEEGEKSREIKKKAAVQKRLADSRGSRSPGGGSQRSNSIMSLGSVAESEEEHTRCADVSLFGRRCNPVFVSVCLCNAGSGLPP